MYDPMEPHQILVLRRAGFSLRDVARESDVSLDTVLRALEQSRVAGRAGSRGVGRPRVATPFEESAQRTLQATPDLKRERTL